MKLFPFRGAFTKADAAERFAKCSPLYRGIEGWFSKEAAAVWDSLLSFQEETGVMGNLLEIGVWKGKSAVLMALHADLERESCVLVDVDLDREAIQAALEKALPEHSGSVQLLEADSRTLSMGPLVREGFESYRWVHIDGEHSARAITNDLAVANKLLCDDGIVVVDDFFNWLYPQVTEATFRYVREKPEDFSIFLCGYNKAYLARPHHVHKVQKYCAEELCTALEKRGAETTVAKSTLPAESNIFGVGYRFTDQRMRGPDWDQGTIRV